MAIFRRTVSKYGKSGGYIILPASFISKEVVIIADDDLQQFSDLLQTSYMLNKVSGSEISLLNQKLDNLKNEINPRLNLLDRLVTSLIKPPQLVKQNSGTNNNEPQKEQTNPNTPNNTTNPDN